MLSTYVIIPLVSLNYMPHHVLLFSIISGTILLPGILNNESQVPVIWLYSMLYHTSGSFHRSPWILNYILYKCFKDLHIQRWHLL